MPMNHIPPDPTNSNWPVRRVSCSQTPIKPAKSGFFHALRRDSIPRVLAEWVLLLAVILGLIAMTGCAGPTDTQAAQMVADEVHAVENAAPIDQQVGWLMAQANGDRPADISPEDWALIQDAMRAMRGGK